MKTRTFITTVIFVLTFVTVGAQTIDQTTSSVRTLTIEPAIGIHANFGTDLLISNLIQWNPKKRLSFASHSSFNINNLTQRSFSYVKTEYNYSLNQKFGVGTTWYAKKRSHTFLLMAGVKYTAYKETLENPNLDKASASISSLNLDYGMMYSFKRGWKKYFFTGRFYLPLHPWLTKGADMNNLQGTLQDCAIELGVGVRIK